MLGKCSCGRLRLVSLGSRNPTRRRQFRVADPTGLVRPHVGITLAVNLAAAPLPVSGAAILEFSRVVPVLLLRLIVARVGCSCGDIEGDSPLWIGVDLGAIGRLGLPGTTNHDGLFGGDRLRREAGGFANSLLAKLSHQVGPAPVLVVLDLVDRCDRSRASFRGTRASPSTCILAP